MILLIADIHLKLGQKNVPKEWAINRYNLFFDKINELENQVSTIVIPGDIFDRLPTLEELNLFFKFIADRKTKTIISTGNHEAITKKESFFKYIKDVSESLNKNVEIVLEPKDFGSFYVVPYEYIKSKDFWDSLEIKPIFTHVRGEIPPLVDPEIPLEWLERFPVVFAGDLHSHANTQRNIVYPGSPMTTSFHRTESFNGCILINSDWSYKWVDLKLPQLIRKTVKSEEEMIKTEFDHTIYEIEGNIKDLSNINSELLDKKIVTKKSDVALVLDPSMSIEQELREYLLYIQELTDEQTFNVIRVFNEHNKIK